MTTDTFTLDLFAPEDAALPLAEQLHAWQQEGLLRQLDVAWMQFVQAQDPQAAPCLLMASALLAHMEGRGHSCLPLAALLQQPQQLLGWDNQAQAALSAQWQQLPTQ
ncbi:MAG: exodeoxyribonuclease V subunit alpha, partial [Comamonas sp.]|nr:exodeoxyribonuclease V subunit alpha [Comamonas sp.]